MLRVTNYFFSVCLLLAGMAPVALAADSAINTMAGIVMHLNHYPSGSEKKTLTDISLDSHSTAGEKILAEALINIQHKIGGNDARRLQSLMTANEASKQEQELADILLGLAHHPSAADKQRLQRLMN